VSKGLVFSLERKLNIDPSLQNWEQQCNITIIRKGFDSRKKAKKQPTFSYTVDVEIPPNLKKFFKGLSPVVGKIEKKYDEKEVAGNVEDISKRLKDLSPFCALDSPKIVIVGSGPAGE